MKKNSIDTLILDLDNTLFDWFAIWYATFKPVYDEIMIVSRLSEGEVQKSIRAVHQKRRTSEYTFLLEEMDILAQFRDQPNADIRTLFHSALEKSRQAKDKHLKLYPGVLRGLWQAKAAGVKIIAYTESMSFYSAYRLKRVGLDGVIDILFCPEDHDTPAGISIDKFRSFPDEFYELQIT